MAKAKKKPAVPQFEVWVMAEGSQMDFYDAGMAKLQKSIGRIKKTLTDAGKLALFSSGSPESTRTAGIMMEDPWVSSHSVTRSVAHGFGLYEHTLSHANKAPTVVAQLAAFGSNVIAKAGTIEHAGMVLITGPQFLTDLDEKTTIDYDGPASTEPFAVNHFQIPIATQE